MLRTAARTLGLLLIVVAASAAVADTCPPAPLTRDGLAALKKSGFQVPDDEERNRTALLLPQCLGDPDPEMRDGVAFEAFYTWLRASALKPETIRTLAAKLTPELKAADDAAGFRKPFVALVLSEVVRADRVGSVLEPADRQAIVDATVQFLTGVTDYRGFDPKVGWRHGVAHGADLVLQLGLNPNIGAADLRRLLGAAEAQIAPAKGGVAYVFGEPERLARAVFYIYRRGLLGDEVWDQFLAGIGTPPPGEFYRTTEGLARRHNKVAFLHAIGFAGRAAGDEAGAKLAALADRELKRLAQ